MYNQKVFENFKNPQNMGPLQDPDGQAEVGNPTCGDVMKIYIKVKANRISAIGFETMGCVAAISTSSMMTQLVKGKTLEQAQKISYNDIAEALGGLPPVKLHCSQLAILALGQAIQDFYEKNKLQPKSEK